ncbi:MAG TPA: PDZ domain-containing protein [Thermoanaerobaculia bacterium]|nr:PDZ domain-containing protein [Thermoanaerobaculia bacterium]
MKRLTITLIAGLMALPLLAQTEQKQERRKVIITGDGVEVLSDADGPKIFFASTGGGYLGISSSDISGELREHFGASKETGVLVGKVFEGTPAAGAGLQVGDVITQIDGQNVSSTWQVSKVLSGKKKGDQVRVDYIRNRAPQQAWITLDERTGDTAFRYNSRDLLHREELLKGLGEMRFNVEVPEGKAARVLQLRNCDELKGRISELESRLKELEKQTRK